MKVRSKTAIRTTPTRHFADPSIAAVLLGATPEKLMFDFKAFGLLFKSLCMHDLRVYIDKLGGNVFHYRDKSGLEYDAVLELVDGRFALIKSVLGTVLENIMAAIKIKELWEVDKTIDFD